MRLHRFLHHHKMASNPLSDRAVFEMGHPPTPSALPFGAMPLMMQTRKCENCPLDAKLSGRRAMMQSLMQFAGLQSDGNGGDTHV